MANPEKIGGKEPEETSPPKESKPSGLSKEGFRLWVRGNEAWGISQMPEIKRKELEPRLFGSEGYSPRRAQKIYQEIKNFPNESKKKYGIGSDAERSQILKILERSLEK